MANRTELWWDARQRRIENGGVPVYGDDDYTDCDRCHAPNPEFADFDETDKIPGCDGMCFCVECFEAIKKERA